MFRSILPAALLVAAASVAHASEADVESPPIIVTATRTAQTVDETLASVTVITRADIEQQQARSVQDLLRGVVGLTVVNNGGAGKPTSVFMRGTESGHVLVLVDGVKVGSATLGSVSFQDIPVDQVERIEIVRGPRSSLYGSEAIGGVIQIFTRRGDGALTPYVSVTAGSYKTYSASAGVSGGDGKNWYSVSGTDLTSRGFNACSSTLGGGGCNTYEPDRDGNGSVSASLRAGRRFGTGTEIELYALRAQGRNEYDQADDYPPPSYAPVELGPNSSRIVQQVVGASAKLRPMSMWQASLLVGSSRDESENFKAGGVFDGRIDTRRDTVSFQNDFTIGASRVITVGVDYQNDQVNSTVAYMITERSNLGSFIQYQDALGAHDLQLAWRNDDNEQFGRHDTGSVAWGYRMDSGLRLTASYGTAFKAPTFNDLYWPGYGNPNLIPETSRSVELGARGKTADTHWSLALYQTEVDDLIAYDAANYSPGNIQTARLRGVEAQIGARLGDWDTQAGVTVLDPENLSSGTYQGNLLPRRAEQSLRVDLDRSFGIHKLGATVRAEGRRYDDLANTIELPAYATLDLRAERALGNDWRLQARIENLTDKHYETAAYYNQPGRSGYLTLRYQPARR